MTKSHVLYVGEECPGSEVCLRLLEMHPSLEMQVSVESIDDLIKGDMSLPAWLDGSPILASRHQRHKNVAYGTEAKNLLLEMLDTASDGSAGSGPGRQTAPKFVSSVAAEEELNFGGGLWDGSRAQASLLFEDGDTDKEAPKLDDAVLKDAIAKRVAQNRAGDN